MQEWGSGPCTDIRWDRIDLEVERRPYIAVDR